MNYAIGSHTHAVMFHHFHDGKHPVGQGSLSADQFEAMLDWLSERYRLLSADEYLYKLHHNTLDGSDICLSFDDALLCQADIAQPVLKSRNLRAFFFIYSSPFSGEPDYLEVYRFFRMTEYPSVDHFYRDFFHEAKSQFETRYQAAEGSDEHLRYLEAYPFYTANDRWFRFLRDKVIDKGEYESLMLRMMEKKSFDLKNSLGRLWMNDAHLTDLRSEGHLLGLHSYSHPTNMGAMSQEYQLKEYSKNYAHLSDLLGEGPVAMSHPCGRYNGDTLDILRSMKIAIGFGSNIAMKDTGLYLELPRQDHANVLLAMTESPEGNRMARP